MCDTPDGDLFMAYVRIPCEKNDRGLPLLLFCFVTAKIPSDNGAKPILQTKTAKKTERKRVQKRRDIFVFVCKKIFLHARNLQSISKTRVFTTKKQQKFARIPQKFQALFFKFLICCIRVI
jgi:hypothetical protein